MEARQLGSGIPVKGQKHVTWDQRRSQPSIVLGWASPDNKYKEAGSSSQKMKEDWSGQSSRWSQRKRGEYTGRQEQIIKGSHWLEWGGCILLYWLWEVTKEIWARNRCQLCFPADRLPPWCTLSTVSTRNQSLVGTPKVQVSKFLYPQTCFTNILCTLRMSEARASHPFLMSIFTLRPALPVRYNLTDDPRPLQLQTPYFVFIPYATIIPHSSANSTWSLWSYDISLQKDKITCPHLGHPWRSTTAAGYKRVWIRNYSPPREEESTKER